MAVTSHNFDWLCVVRRAFGWLAGSMIVYQENVSFKK